MEQSNVLQLHLEEEPQEAPSPFIEGTFIQYAWDSTSLDWFKRCGRLYQYEMIEGFVSGTENIHLRWGQEVHQALHDYEISKAAGIGHDDAVHDVTRALLVRIHDWRPEPRTKTEELKTKANLVRTVIWYLDQFKDDPARTYIMADGRPAMEVSFRFELDFGPAPIQQPYLLCGHLDRIVEFQDELFVMDRKTTTTTPTDYYFAQFKPNNQMSLYTLAAQVIFQAPVKGVIIDAIQVAQGFSRVVRRFVYHTKDELEEWLRDLQYHLARAEDYAAEGYWPKNDTSCDKYGGCKFRDVCSRAPSVRERFLSSDFERRERWNPLAIR